MIVLLVGTNHADLRISVPECGKEVEALQKISDAPLTDCPECGASELKKKVSAAAFRLKGGGWYETDFKTGNKKNLAGGAELASLSRRRKQEESKKESKKASKSDPKTKPDARPLVPDSPYYGIELCAVIIVAPWVPPISTKQSPSVAGWTVAGTMVGSSSWICGIGRVLCRSCSTRIPKSTSSARTACAASMC